MNKNRWNLVLALGLILMAALACNYSFSTANLSDLKISKDEEGKNEASTFGPGDKVYAVTNVANNPGKQQVKFRLLYDDVKGEKAGEMVPGAEKTFDVDKDQRISFWVTLPPSGFKNGRYKIEATMTDEKGEKKDTKSGTFTINGFSDADSAPPAAPPSDEGNNN